jgi:hypothetical protein
MCCNPKGRVYFEDGSMVKSSCTTDDEMKACFVSSSAQKSNRKKPQKIYRVANE